MVDPTVSMTGATRSSGGDDRNTVALSTPINGASFAGRYGGSDNTDTGVGTTQDPSRAASHQIEFIVTRVV